MHVKGGFNMTDNITLNPNKIVTYLQKNPEEFTRKDIIKFIENNNIRMVNFRFTGGDGKLKTLNFVITDKGQLDRILSTGERVDGSSLFSYIDASSSDLYVIPRYKTAFVNPFSSVPSVDILCSYYTNEGLPLPSAPEYIVRKAHKSLKETTGLTMEAMAELEYYVFYDRQGLYPIVGQKGYQESAPFIKWEHIRCEAMYAIAQAGGKIKYGHAEVGNITGEKHDIEQHEIEFVPTSIEDAADQIVTAKWILRMIANKYGLMVTFAPKILVGHAGSGLHIHTRFLKDGHSVMTEQNRLSDRARKTIAGYLSLAPSLTAFGNTIPTSYLRLVPKQEAPTNICWGDRNRSVLVRVPLGWLGVSNMIKDANPGIEETMIDSTDKQTVEFRCPDGSANIYHLLAGLSVAARHGLTMEDSLEVAEKLYVDVNIFSSEHKKIQEKLPKLPASCWESAKKLLEQRKIYEKDDVFTPTVIDGIEKTLKHYGDKDLNKNLYGMQDEIKELVDHYINC